MLFVVLLVLAAVGVVLLMSVAGLDRAGAKTRARAFADAEATYADLFDGRSTAVYVSHDAALPVDTINEAADRHGYDVVSVQPGGQGFNAQTITYRRRPDAPPPPPKRERPPEEPKKRSKWEWISASVFLGAVLLWILIASATS